VGVSKRKRQSFFRKGIKGYVDSLAEIINDIIGLKEDTMKLFLEHISATKQ
jgi:hypothetical protein